MMKSAKLEWTLGDPGADISLLDEGLKLFPDFAKLWMMKEQAFEQKGEPRNVYNAGLKKCGTSVPLWLLLSHLDKRSGQVIKARSVLERAYLRNPKTTELWLEAVRDEKRALFHEMSLLLMAKALQECLNAGMLWAEAIFLEP